MTFDLDLNINRDHLLIKDYLRTEFEVSGAKPSWVISFTRLRDTDIPSLRESLKFLQDRRSGERRYFTWPYTILPDRQILSHDSQLDTSANGPHQLLQLQDNKVLDSSAEKSNISGVVFNVFCSKNNLHMCLWNTDAPGGNKVKLWQKSLSPTIWPRSTPGGWDVSEVWGTLKWTYSPSLVTVSSPKL